jgi:hypothetical protein
LSLRAALGISAAAILAGSSALAQQRSSIVSQADSAYSAGNIALADSLYYIAVRYWPRDPIARRALGNFLAAQGKAKPASILLEEARMFGGDPATIGTDLAPLYERLGEWRALLTLPGSPLSMAELRRAAWLSEHPFAVISEGGAATIIGKPKADTIARVAARIGGRAVVAAILGTDADLVVGTSLAEDHARRFEGDPTVVTFDSLTIAQVRFANVPAAVGTEAATVTLGAAALGRRVMQIDYARNRIVITRTDAAPASSKYPLAREGGELRVLDRGRWIPLSEFAAAVAKSAKTLVIDVAAGEVRVRP